MKDTHNPRNTVHSIAGAPVVQSVALDVITSPQVEANRVYNVQDTRANLIATKELVKEILVFIGVGIV